MSDLYLNEASVESQSDTVDMYKNAFSKALTQTGHMHLKNALELGAGCGSCTYAMAELLPDLKIIASELSAQMLQRHKKIGMVKYPACEKQIVRCQINADQDIFKDNSFDLVFGTAILHHVFEPLKVIKNVGKILKPNGIAIFIEPFEPGNGLLRIAYEFILKQYSKGQLTLEDRERNYLQNAVYHWSSISNVDSVHSMERLRGIDDKWIFPYEYFDKTAKEADFDIIYKLSLCFVAECGIENLSKVYAEENNLELSSATVEIVQLIDKCFSKQQMHSMIHSGILVLQKSKH